MAHAHSVPVAISLGSNLGDRLHHLRRAIDLLARRIRLVRLSSLFATAPLDCDPGDPEFLNLVVVGLTRTAPRRLLGQLLEIEDAMGRRRRRPHEPRAIDLDLILYGAQQARSRRLVLPHPRFAQREFVLAGLREIDLPWVDPRDGRDLASLRGLGEVRKIGPLYLPAP